MDRFFPVVFLNAKRMCRMSAVIALEQRPLGNVLNFFKTNGTVYSLKPLLVDVEAERYVFLFLWFV